MTLFDFEIILVCPQQQHLLGRKPPAKSQKKKKEEAKISATCQHSNTIHHVECDTRVRWCRGSKFKACSGLTPTGAKALLPQMFVCLCFPERQIIISKSNHHDSTVHNSRPVDVVAGVGSGLCLLFWIGNNLSFLLHSGFASMPTHTRTFSSTGHADEKKKEGLE